LFYSPWNAIDWRRAVYTDRVKVDPLVPQLLIDYDYFCSVFGPLAFGEFVIVWHAADVLTQSAVAEGFAPHESPDLFVTDAAAEESIH